MSTTKDKTAAESVTQSNNPERVYKKPVGVRNRRRKEPAISSLDAPSAPVHESQEFRTDDLSAGSSWDSAPFSFNMSSYSPVPDGEYSLLAPPVTQSDYRDLDNGGQEQGSSALYNTTFASSLRDESHNSSNLDFGTNYLTEPAIYGNSPTMNLGFDWSQSYATGGAEVGGATVQSYGNWDPQFDFSTFPSPFSNAAEPIVNPALSSTDYLIGQTSVTANHDLDISPGNWLPEKDPMSVIDENNPSSIHTSAGNSDADLAPFCTLYDETISNNLDILSQFSPYVVSDVHGQLQPAKDVSTIDVEVTTSPDAQAAKILDLETRLQTAESLLAKKNLNGDEKQIRDFQDDITRLEGLYNTVSEEKEAIEYEKNILDGQFNSLKQEHNELQSSHTHLQNQYNILQNNKEGLEGDIKRLDREGKEAKLRVKELENEPGQQQQQPLDTVNVQKLIAEKCSLSSMNSLLTKEKDSLINENMRLTGVNTSLNSDITNLQNQILQLTNNAHNVVDRVYAENIVRNLESERDKARQDLIGMVPQGLLDSANQDIGQLTNSINTHQCPSFEPPKESNPNSHTLKELDELKIVKTNLEAANSVLDLEVKAIKAENEKQLKAREDKAQKDNRTYTDRIATLSKERNEARSEREEAEKLLQLERSSNSQKQRELEELENSNRTERHRLEEDIAKLNLASTEARQQFEADYRELRDELEASKAAETEAKELEESSATEISGLTAAKLELEERYTALALGMEDKDQEIQQLQKVVKALSKKKPSRRAMRPSQKRRLQNVAMDTDSSDDEETAHEPGRGLPASNVVRNLLDEETSAPPTLSTSEIPLEPLRLTNTKSTDEDIVEESLEETGLPLVIEAGNISSTPESAANDKSEPLKTEFSTVYLGQDNESVLDRKVLVMNPDVVSEATQTHMILGTKDASIQTNSMVLRENKSTSTQTYKKLETNETSTQTSMILNNEENSTQTDLLIHKNTPLASTQIIEQLADTKPAMLIPRRTEKRVNAEFPVVQIQVPTTKALRTFFSERPLIFAILMLLFAFMVASASIQFPRELMEEASKNTSANVTALEVFQAIVLPSLYACARGGCAMPG